MSYLYHSGRKCQDGLANVIKTLPFLTFPFGQVSVTLCPPCKMAPPPPPPLRLLLPPFHVRPSGPKKNTHRTTTTMDNITSGQHHLWTTKKHRKTNTGQQRELIGQHPWTTQTNRTTHPSTITQKPPLQSFQLGHSGDVTCLAVSPNGLLVATGEVSRRPCVLVWQADSGDVVQARYA